MHWANHLKKQRRPPNYNKSKGWGTIHANDFKASDVLAHVLNAVRITDSKFFRDQDEKDEYDAISNDKHAMRYYLSARVSRGYIGDIMDLWNFRSRGNLHPYTRHSMQQKEVAMQKIIEHSMQLTLSRGNNPIYPTGRDYADDRAKQMKRTLNQQYQQRPHRNFRVANFKTRYLRDEDGRWINYTNADCCTKFVLGYFWFLKYIRQTSRLKTVSGDKFKFADLGFPPVQVFQNYQRIRSALVPRSDFQAEDIDKYVSERDCVNLAQALKSILDGGFLQQDIHMKNMVVSLFNFWEKRYADCDFYELMDDLNYISDDMKLVQRKQMQQYMTNTMFKDGPAGGNA